jgi:pimeloyl-ACP methyl ester carboxylesterase
LAYVWRARFPRGASVLSPFPTVEFTVYPNECDAFGHLNQAALLALLERARWDALALGPGADLFDRNGVWPALRKAVIEYKAGLFPRDRLRIETTVVHRGTTSFTLRHTVRRVGDDTLAAEADLVFVCVDRIGRAKPVPEEIARFLGPRTSGAHQPVRVPVGDVELDVEVRGEGLPVLFVHGFPFDHTVWRHQIATLGRCKRIAPDLRGVGSSGTPSAADGYSMARYAADLVAVLDALGVREAALCGLSMGGYVIFELMRRYPERVKALVLVDTKPEADSAEAKRGRDALARLAEREGQNAVVEQLLPSLLSAGTRTTEPDVVAQVREMGRRWSVPGLVGALGALRERPDSTDTLGRIGVPTLVLVGGDDEVVSPSVARAMARRIPGAQCHVIPAAGHIAPLEQPLATSRLVADFLNALA